MDASVDAIAQSVASSTKRRRTAHADSHLTKAVYFHNCEEACANAINGIDTAHGLEWSSIEFPFDG